MIHNKSYMLCRHMLLTCGGDGEQVFPTMLDAAGATATVPAGHQIDGMSLLCLLKDPSGASCSGCTSATGCAADGSGWRQWLDLEHTTCYNATNHWSALTDGKMKYIFNACPTCTFPPREQLFNLTAVRTPSPEHIHRLRVSQPRLVVSSLRVHSIDFTQPLCRCVCRILVSRRACTRCLPTQPSWRSGAGGWWRSSRRKGAARSG